MIKRLDQSTETIDRQFLDECKTAIRQVIPRADLILYGSRARGDAHDDSDYDLLVLIDGQVDMQIEQVIIDKLFPLELNTGNVLTILVYNRAKWDTALYQAMPFHRNVTRDGLLI